MCNLANFTFKDMPVSFSVHLASFLFKAMSRSSCIQSCQIPFHSHIQFLSTILPVSFSKLSLCLFVCNLLSFLFKAMLNSSGAILLVFLSKSYQGFLGCNLAIFLFKAMSRSSCMQSC